MSTRHPRVGFMVWNPARGMPTMVHDTIEQASAEAERLTRQNPGEHFIIMSPVLSTEDANLGRAWSDGARFMGARVDAAEANAKRMIDDAIQYEAKAKHRFAVIERDQRRFQAIVADCLLWFDGFRAAHSPKDSWERPHVPDRDVLRDLNGALQDLEPMQSDFEEIPF